MAMEIKRHGSTRLRGLGRRWLCHLGCTKLYNIGRTDLEKDDDFTLGQVAFEMPHMLSH